MSSHKFWNKILIEIPNQIDAIWVPIFTDNASVYGCNFYDEDDANDDYDDQADDDNDDQADANDDKADEK